MKKLALAICMCAVTLFTASAQTLAWSTVADIFTTMLDSQASSLEQEFKQMGLDVTVSSNYNEAQKTIEMNLTFPDSQAFIVQAMDSSILDMMKAQFVEAFVADDENGDEMKMIIDSMEKNNGKIAINMKSGSTQKSVVITAADLKNAM